MLPSEKLSFQEQVTPCGWPGPSLITQIMSRPPITAAIETSRSPQRQLAEGHAKEHGAQLPEELDLVSSTPHSLGGGPRSSCAVRQKAKGGPAWDSLETSVGPRLNRRTGGTPPFSSPRGSILPLETVSFFLFLLINSRLKPSDISEIFLV